MRMQQINRVSSTVLIILSLTALLTVLTGYIYPPQRVDWREYIFQLSIVALVPMTVVFVGTANWIQPLRSVRPLAFAVALSTFAFAGLYILEHYR